MLGGCKQLQAGENDNRFPPHDPATFAGEHGELCDLTVTQFVAKEFLNGQGAMSSPYQSYFIDP